MRVLGIEKMRNTVAKIASSEEEDVGFPMYIAWYVAGLAMIVLSVAT